ncbi:branched-chain amino acid ABC transporter permease [Ferrovibrio sp. MS7]|uniref:branched-chain amino acid ABC transporter permease n=1 Tax=Ferrovibrio plantarum TaxID=3119164 RepID=UPI0031370C49
MTMRGLAPILIFAFVLAPLPLLVQSDFWLTWLTLALFYAYLGQAWNLLGGYGGQFSFGHALFFGTGAYCTAILQIRFGINAWGGFGLSAIAAGAVGAGTGWLVFRYGLRGSYFALVTLAFAEVFRILANTFAFTGAGVGLLVPLQPGFAQMQFPDKAGFFWLLLALVTAALLLTWWLENARFGARLMAVRENEEAARALGVDPFATKLGAIVLSGALAGTGGAIYVQLFLYIDPGIAYGPAMSVEALLVPIIGGLGTIFGPVLGAFALHAIAEIGRMVFGEAPGLNLVLYGLLLVLMVLFLPNGLFGLGKARFGSGALRRLFKRGQHA